MTLRLDSFDLRLHYLACANLDNHPDNIKFLARLREVMEPYGAAAVGEVGDAQRGLEIMGEYTAGTDRLHMAYSFAMLGPDFSAEHFRNCIEGFQSGAPDGHPYWSFSNHDVPRQVTRWADYAVSEDSIARLACAMLMSFEGTIGIYQGEELGQTETELTFEELTDPPAIRYWPAVKGRDGCRTPMVWEKDAPNAGFTTGKPWLPVKAPQAAKAVDQQGADSILAYYRKMIAYRKDSPALARGKTTFISLPEPLLAFHRIDDEQTLTCIFNLSTDRNTFSLKAAAEIAVGQAASLKDRTLTLDGNGFAYLSYKSKAPL